MNSRFYKNFISIVLGIAIVYLIYNFTISNNYIVYI